MKINNIVFEAKFLMNIKKYNFIIKCLEKTIFVFLLFQNYVFSQKNDEVKPLTIEVEITGRPSWQKIIPLGNDGVLLFVKKDITKALLLKFDKDLKKIWDSEIFLDAENQPTSYSIDNQIITFVFSENQGMYYQVFNIDLETGKFQNNGFELKEFFQDQGFFFFDDKIFMAGLNEKGACFYKYNFVDDNGVFTKANIEGKTKVQYIQYLPQQQTIESLWSVKLASFTNEKKKKGEYIKDAYVVFAQYDTTGKLLLKNIIPSNAGNFPLTANLLKINPSLAIISGTYQSNTGVKGIFFSKIEEGKTTLTKFYDYKSLMSYNSIITDEVIKKLSKDYTFYQTATISNNNVISIGGSFFQPRFEIVSSTNPYYNTYSPNFTNLGLSSSDAFPNAKSKQIFKGFNFANGFIANFDLEGNLLSQVNIEMNQTSPQLDETLALADNHAVAVCVSGNVILGNYLGFKNKKIAKLSDEPGDIRNAQFIASYHGVRKWYENYFIADGSRIKFEAIKEMDTLKIKPTKRKKGQQSIPQTNIKKIIYLSKLTAN